MEAVRCVSSAKELMRSISVLSDEPFYVADLGQVLKLYHLWRTHFPSIKPFYAVKCNAEPILLKMLAKLGAGFDCASKLEIQTILNIGVDCEHIIYANPIKQISHLKYAKECGVSYMTFDNQMELHKIAEYHPKAKLVIRIEADDPTAGWLLGTKFGCSVEDGYQLLLSAKKLGLLVVGVSFHVGCGCQNPEAYKKALESAYQLFAYAESVGYKFTLLDIGGGFPGPVRDHQNLLTDIADKINSTLSELFTPKYPKLDIIAEPGTYFCASPYTTAVSVIGKRAVPLCSTKENEQQKFDYYLNAGIYSSLVYAHVDCGSFIVDLKLLNERNTAKCFDCCFWGPTCDSGDKIWTATLPELDIGDWLYMEDNGSYTISVHSTFNGFPKEEIYYFVLEEDREVMVEQFAKIMEIK